ncbi:AraC family transcriptional regulator [Pandoraea pnomenusa]|uniref:helix-turn-helix transcriptional regulator n=1 Tax=Pandoraea pnomenusa TaxID=93220 RepID=UPI00333F91ED
MVTSEPWRHAIDLDGLSLARGVQRASAGESVREALDAGAIKIVFLLDGALHWGANGASLLRAAGGSVNVCFGAQALDIENVYGESGALRYCSLRVSERYLQTTCGLDAHALTRGWRDAVWDARCASGPADVRGDWCERSAVLTRPMSADERRWASAMISPPAHDSDAAWQRLALVGQSFDALARCAAYVPDRASDASRAPRSASVTAGPSGDHVRRACESQRERATRRAVLAARDLLDTQLQTPPSLPALAREVGINVNKLCAGFREQFGTTVHGYVRERRLATAFTLLSARRISVSEAAWQCGYTDSHFTKVFRERFGVLPNTLTREVR